MGRFRANGARARRRAAPLPALILPRGAGMPGGKPLFYKRFPLFLASGPSSRVLKLSRAAMGILYLSCFNTSGDHFNKFRIARPIFKAKQGFRETAKKQARKNK